jgi:hypothetical protein
MGARQRGRRGRGRWSGCRGETLAELLVTTTLLGIVGAGVIGAIGTILLANHADRRAADGEAVMRTFVAAVQRAPYAECDDGDEAYQAVAAGLDARAFRARIAPCGPPGPDGVQHLELALDPLEPDGRADPAATLRATVYKRDPT